MFYFQFLYLCYNLLEFFLYTDYFLLQLFVFLQNLLRSYTSEVLEPDFHLLVHHFILLFIFEFFFIIVLFNNIFEFYLHIFYKKRLILIYNKNKKYITNIYIEINN